MVVDRRRNLVFLSGPRLSLSRPVSASRCRSSISTGAAAGEPAAILVLLLQPGWLLSVCASVRDSLANRAGESSYAIRTRSVSTRTCACAERPAILVLLQQSSRLLPHPSGVSIRLAARTGTHPSRGSALGRGANEADSNQVSFFLLDDDPGLLHDLGVLDDIGSYSFGQLLRRGADEIETIVAELLDHARLAQHAYDSLLIRSTKSCRNRSVSKSRLTHWQATQRIAI